MNLKQLEYFVSVAELGSFSKAAEALEIAQPALSRQVRSLETDLHETLLLRNGRGVSLTDAGRRLFDHSVELLQQVARVREDMGAAREEPVGRVTIGLPPSIGRQVTVPLVEAFTRQLPKAHLAIIEGLSADIAERIANGRIDLGLLFNPDVHPALRISPLLEEPLCLVERASDTCVNRAPLPLRELGRYALIVPERQHVLRRLVETQASLFGQTLDIRWEVSSVASIVDLVCAGHGHAVLTASAVGASGRADELNARPLIEPALSSVLCLATPAHKRPGPLLRQASLLLSELVRSLPQSVAAQSIPG